MGKAVGVCVGVGVVREGVGVTLLVGVGESEGVIVTVGEGIIVAVLVFNTSGVPVVPNIPEVGMPSTGESDKEAELPRFVEKIAMTTSRTSPPKNSEKLRCMG